MRVAGGKWIRPVTPQFPSRQCDRGCSGARSFFLSIQITHPMSTLSTIPEPPGAQTQTFDLIASAAKDKDFDAEKFKVLAQIHREERDHQQRTEAFRDLAQFKSACPPIRKTRTVSDNSGNRRYNYASLDDLMRQIGPLMRQHNLSATYTHETKDGQHFTTCRLLHLNGFCFPDSQVQVNRAQANRMTSECQVSGITQSYGERYALKAALGLVFTDEDTDGIDPEANHQQEPTVDDMILALMAKRGIDDSALEAAMTAKGFDLKGWGWRELPGNVKERIFSGWGNLFGNGGDA